MTDAELTSELSDRLARVHERMTDACRRSGRQPSEVTLVATTKTVSVRVARALFELGVADLGESRPQELWRKAEAIPEARWHQIGHLQRNKIDKTLPLVVLTHSVDSSRLLEAINRFGTAEDRRLPILLEINCSREQAKGGFSPDELPKLAETLPTYTGVDVQGLMTMAAYHEDPNLCRPTFVELRQLGDHVRQLTGLPLPHLSMGMSNDFEVAIEEGATIIRLGTTLFEGLEAE